MYFIGAQYARRGAKSDRVKPHSPIAYAPLLPGFTGTAPVFCSTSTRESGVYTVFTHTL